MNEPKRKPESRNIKKQIELDAPAEGIWQMFPDPRELVRWFPIERFWFSTYGMPTKDVEGLEASWSNALERILS